MISIIVPTFNIEPYLRECLDSIRNQSFGDFEVIMVDDGSTDGTLAIAKEYAESDSRFSLVAQEHSSAGTARNKGMGLASGDYYLFFDSDDYMAPHMLEKMAAQAELTNADIVVCQAFSFEDATGNVLTESISYKGIRGGTVFSGEEIAGHLFESIMGWPWDKLFKASYVKSNDLKFQEIASTNDAFFVFVGLALAERIAFIEDSLVAHRIRRGSIEHSRSATPQNAAIAQLAIAARLASTSRWPALERSFLNWRLVHSRWNYRTLEDEARVLALRDYVDALRAVHDRDDSYMYHEEDRAARRALQSQIPPSLHVVDQAINMQEQIWETRSLQDELRLTREEVERGRAEIGRLEQTVQCQRTCIEDIEQSESYRLGLFLTAPFRKIKGITKKVVR